MTRAKTYLLIVGLLSIISFGVFSVFTMSTLETARHFRRQEEIISSLIPQGVVERAPLDTDDGVHVSLVTQTSLDLFRINRVKLMIDRWPGNITIVAVDTDGKSKAIYEQLVEDVRAMGRAESVDLHYHLQKVAKKEYPINKMRNKAIKLSKNDLYLSLDVDFIPSETLYKNLMDQAELLRRMEHEKMALIVPAFDLLSAALINQLTTKEKLLPYWGSKVHVFHHNFPFAHAATNYDQWRTAETIYNITYADHYEPYFVCHKANCPLYREEFVGFAYNKLEQVYEMWVHDFAFQVMPKDFVFHIPHLYSKKIRGQTNIVRSMRMFIKMQKELVASHGKLWLLFDDKPTDLKTTSKVDWSEKGIDVRFAKIKKKHQREAEAKLPKVTNNKKP